MTFDANGTVRLMEMRNATPAAIADHLAKRGLYTNAYHAQVQYYWDTGCSNYATQVEFASDYGCYNYYIAGSWSNNIAHEYGNCCDGVSLWPGDGCSGNPVTWINTDGNCVDNNGVGVRSIGAVFPPAADCPSCNF
jgi:hypothetical protein